MLKVHVLYTPRLRIAVPAIETDIPGKMRTRSSLCVYQPTGVQEILNKGHWCYVCCVIAVLQYSVA